MLSALTSLFLHGGWLHLLGNMLFYLACGVVATYGFALVNAQSSEVLIGASGAIAGVLGAYLILYPRARVWSQAAGVPWRPLLPDLDAPLLNRLLAASGAGGV